ncbi:helix-turn-helix domain-containing protein [Pediococcus acidilactici]
MRNIFNKEQNIAECDIAKILPILNSRWTLPIIYYLSFGSLRFSELKRKLPPLADSNYSKVLRNLVQFGLIKRVEHRAVPSKVVYSLTELGTRILPIMQEMEKYSDYYSKHFTLK